MRSYFYYLYYRYLFYYDPTHAWFKQSLKVVIASVMAGAVTLYHPTSFVIWLVLPTVFFMLMVDITQTLRKRLLFITLQWLLASIALSGVSYLLTVSWVAACGFFLFMAFIALFIANQKPLYLRSCTAFLIYLLVALAKPIEFFSVDVAWFYLSIAFLISLIVTVSIWPLLLKDQIQHTLVATELILGRFIVVSINDAIRGNYSVVIRQMVREKLLLMQTSLEGLNANYQAQQVNAVLEQQLEQQLYLLKDLIYKAIALENTFNNLPRQSFLFAPLDSIQQVAIQIKQLFTVLPMERATVLMTTRQAIQDLKTTWEQQKKLIKESNAPSIQNLLQWSQVTYLLDRLLCGLEAWFNPIVKMEEKKLGEKKCS